MTECQVSSWNHVDMLSVLYKVWLLVKGIRYDQVLVESATPWALPQNL